MNIALRRYLRCASIKHKVFSSTAILEEIDIRMFNTALCSAKEGTVYILPYLQVLRQYDFLLSTVWRGGILLLRRFLPAEIYIIKLLKKNCCNSDDFMIK